MKTAIVTALSFTLTSSAIAGEIELEVAGGWGGPVNTVDVAGDLAYIGSGRRLVIANVADPANIIELGAIDLLTAVLDVEVRDSFVYVCTDSEGIPIDAEETEFLGYQFCIVDATDPSSPELAWHSTTAEPPFSGPYIFHPRYVELWNDFAFVAHRDAGPVFVFDISDPYNTENIGQTTFDMWDIQIEGDLLYGLRDESGEGGTPAAIRVYDLTTSVLPFFLTFIDKVDLPLFINPLHMSMDVAGDHAYITAVANAGIGGNQDDGYVFTFANMDDPASMMYVGHTLEADYLPIDIEVTEDGQHAYIAEWVNSARSWVDSEGLQILDLADPDKPASIGSFVRHSAIRGAQVFGERAYVFDVGEGMLVLDITDAANPVFLGNYHSPAFVRGVDSQGDLLYVMDQWNGLTILDVSSPAMPSVMSVYQVPHLVLPPPGFEFGNENWTVIVEGDLAYLSAGHAGLIILDVSDPTAPALVTHYEIGDTWASRYTDMHLSHDLDGYETVAHIAYEQKVVCGAFVCTTYFLLNIDVSDPQSIKELDRLSYGSQSIYAMAVNSESFAFLCGGEEPLTADSTAPDRLVEIATPFLPVKDGPPGGGQKVFGVSMLDDDTLLIANAGSAAGGLYVRDVSDPFNQVDVVDVSLPGGSFAVDVQGNHAYVNAAMLTVADGGFPVMAVYDVADPASPALIDFKVWGNAAVGEPDSLIHAAEPWIYATDFAFQSSEIGLAQGLTIFTIDATPTNPADLTGDGVVGPADLAQVLGSWGPCPRGGSCPADLTGDGVVGPADLAQVLGAWG